jgi:hypothetical protein
MKQVVVSIAAMVCVGVASFSLAGCGGGSINGGGGGNGTPPAISNFAAAPNTIEAGSSAQLTGTFSGGTGVITPGNIAATSGVAASVSPTANTTYTLTVTGSSGLTATQTVNITVDPVPTITSFTASPSPIEAGTSTQLTAVFAGGTGMITPGNIPVTSGVAVSVSPATSTTYTLTVSPPVGTVTATQTATVTVNPGALITSFTASPTEIESGSSSSLTADFSGGAGVITPGNISVTSGTPVSVSPTATTTYTLTVTPAVGNATTATATITVDPVPTITSFTASPNPITAGNSTSLTAQFSGGTGEITPGNLPITSGTPVPVSPTTTTTYTLTVTPPAGSVTATQTVTVTVNSTASITSFTASPNPIASGSSTQLTADFSGGTGAITPGNLPVTSGTPVSVSPTTTTTYTLTVTPTVGAAVTQTVTVTVGTGVSVTTPSSPVAVTDQILGVNLAAWYDVVGNASSINPALVGAGIQALRWPGGSWSDQYHWGYQTGSSSLTTPYMCSCSSATSCTAYTSYTNANWAGYSTFAQFASALPEAGHYDLALTADYGTNEACTGGGDPNEAAAWVSAALGDGLTVSHMTVGNEEYGSWETDLHSTPNDPTIYAAAVVGSSGYYDAIKAASPNTLVGVDVDASAGWDDTVLANAKGSYDFVEFHYYPETPGEENDTTLIQDDARNLTTNINTIKSELSKYGTAGTPIYVGEIGGPYSNPGMQSWSITQGLYAGEVLGEMMNDGVSRLTWWIGFGNCNGDEGYPWEGNSSVTTSSVYGWQTFGAYNIFADGSGDTGPNDSPCNYGGPIGSMSPTAEAFNLFQHVAVNGEHVLTASVTGDTTDVRAYAATHGTGTSTPGYALVLFNVNETTPETVTVTLSGATSSTDVSVETYDKEIYDYTNTNCALDPSCTVDPNHNYSTAVWAPPTTTDMGAQTLPLTLTLQPWSMNVVLIQ